LPSSDAFADEGTELFNHYLSVLPFPSKYKRPGGTGTSLTGRYWHLAHYCEGGATTTSEPMSESSSTGSTAGLSTASGRICTSAGAVRAGKSCPKRGCTVSMGW